MEERTQKLLIMVGQQGLNLEGRDFKKLTDLIVDNYVKANNQPYNQYLISMLTKTIAKIPLKQHIYAGLTAQIRRDNQKLATQIVQKAITDLCGYINKIQLHSAINVLIFLAQLMNISVINSLVFLNLLQDLTIFMEHNKNPQHQAFLAQLITRTLPYYCYSLNEKVTHDFKKFIERVRKYCGNSRNLLFAWIFDQFHKRNLTDHSLMNRLETSFPQGDQLEINFKIDLKIDQSLLFQPIQYCFITREFHQKLYQQFTKTEGTMHLYNFQQLIQTFQTNQEFLLNKLTTYIQFYGTSFIYRFAIEALLAKSLKSKFGITQTMLIAKLINHSSSQKAYEQIAQQGISENLQNVTENILLQYFHKQSENNFDLNILYKYTEILSLLVNNIQGADKSWDWSKYVDPNEQENYKKRKIILKITLHKLIMLNDHIKLDPALSIYHPPEVLKNQGKYKTTQDMQIFQAFAEFIKTKADSQQIMSKFQRPEIDYQIFLDALFQKCSLSHTHLEVLMSRYQGIFEKNKQEFDWALITKIRNFWRKSLYHRLLYLGWVIQHDYCDYNSYVKYIGKLETVNEEETLWVRVQLNELNKKFSGLIQQTFK